MKKVLMVTDVSFWMPGSGDKSRISALVDYLGEYLQVKVVFVGVRGDEDSELSNRQRKNYDLVYLDPENELSSEGYSEKVKIFLQEYIPDVCIIEYLRLHSAKKFLPKGTKIILDTHDLVSERRKTFISHGYEHEKIEFSEEIEIFKSFHKVMLIQDEEYQKVCSYLGKNKVLLIPHPVVFSKQKLRKKIRKIGFIGSGYLPNKDGIMWFIENVFPKLKNNLELHIYGGVCSKLPTSLNTNIVVHGFVDSLDQAFSTIDIMINPVRFGAGLKIKNIEALGNGLPLVSTSHCASGITGQINKSFLVADDPGSFVDKLNLLSGNYTKRLSLGKTAHKFIEDHFSPSRCFSPLIQEINGH